MSTQIIEAQKGKMTPEMFAVAEKEGFTHSEIIQKVASGRVAILKNNRRENVIPTAVGEGTTVKINANIGTSLDRSTIEEELAKVKIIEATGADVLMDLSTGDKIDETRKAIIQATNLPIGTVPMYQALDKGNGRLLIGKAVRVLLSVDMLGVWWPRLERFGQALV